MSKQQRTLMIYLIFPALLCSLQFGCVPTAVNDATAVDPTEQRTTPATDALSAKTETPPSWTFRKTTEVSGATSYIFDSDPKPKLTLASDGSTSDTNDVNAVLEFIGLPLIDRNVPDEGEVTGSRIYRGQYHWNDYPLGKLVIERTLATSKQTYKQYDAIWKVRIDKQ